MLLLPRARKTAIPILLLLLLVAVMATTSMRPYSASTLSSAVTATSFRPARHMAAGPRLHKATEPRLYKSVSNFPLAGRERSLTSLRAQIPEALLFDCDGVLVDTEKDGHRVAFNRAFKEMGLNFEWGVEEYGKLLEVGGGKERMTAYFNQVGWPQNWPTDDIRRTSKVKEVHLLKTDIFSKMINSGELRLRPGVERLVSEALSKGVKVACCSTSNEKSVAAVVDLLPADKARQFSIFAGDIVPRKKPDPAVYLLASEKLGVPPERCAVIEDSHIGKCAGKSAGMTVVVTKSGYTGDEDFTGADAIVDELGDQGNEKVTMDFIASLMPSA